MKCRKCEKGANEIGGYLTRVNELGVAGIWECRPFCESQLDQEEKTILAIIGEEPITPTEESK